MKQQTYGKKEKKSLSTYLKRECTIKNNYFIKKMYLNQKKAIMSKQKLNQRLMYLLYI